MSEQSAHPSYRLFLEHADAFRQPPCEVCGLPSTLPIMVTFDGAMCHLQMIGCAPPDLLERNHDNDQKGPTT